MYTTIRIFAMFFLVFAVSGTDSKKHYIQMSTEANPELKREPLKIKVKIGEWMEISCPQYDPDTPKEKQELFYLYDVKDKESYNTCDYKDKLTMLACDSPFRQTKLTLKFQRRSPYPLGFIFQEGQTYYYIGIPVGEKSCHNSMRLEVIVGKEDGADTNIVIPDIKKVTKPPTPRISSTTSTTTTVTTRKTSPKILTTTKSRSVAGSQKGDKDNSASSVKNCMLMTSLLALLTLRWNM